MSTVPSEEAQKLAAMLQDLSLNISSSFHGNAKPNPNNNSLDSSLGLLNNDALKNISRFSECDATKENVEPSNPNISLGKYLQAAQGEDDQSILSQPLSDSEDEQEVPVLSTTNKSDSFKFLCPEPYPFPPAQSKGPQSLEESSFNGFSWDKVAQANTAEDSVSRILQQAQSVTQAQDQDCEDEWHQDFPDPSFCSGKFSARSTSFGGMSNTRDENFSDYSKVPSIQGSYVSQCSTNMEESIFRSGFIGQVSGASSNIFKELDAESQAELGVEFGDNEFGSMGKEQLQSFFQNEEAECLKENPFIEEEPCAAESPGNSSVMSGVSDKSIMLRNSNLWGGDTSKVDLELLRKEDQDAITKLSRCEYFRHNSSRLGSLDESVEEAQRPDLGFFHNIRSPERKPCALLSMSKSSPVVNKPSMSGTFSVDTDVAAPLEVVEDESPSSSANTTYMASGNSTKTVVSMMDQTDTLKAAELVSKLQILVDQISGGGAQAAAISYPDVVEDSICSNTSKLEESIKETIENAADINLSTISKVLAEASISSDPHQFVNVILGCLKNKAQAEKKTQDHEVSQTQDLSNVSNASTSRESKRISFNDRESGGATPKTSATLPRTGRSSTTPTGRLSHTPSSKMTPTESKRAMMRLTPGSSGPMSRIRGSNQTKPIKPFNNNTSLNKPHHVAPVMPQIIVSAPNSARNTPTPPPLSKSESFPTSLNKSNSNRQRKLSGTRHSSPIKKVQIQSPPHRSLVSTPTSDELSKLLDGAETPHLQIAAASHLTTSTPFHPNPNLSHVMLDHLTMNTSISPLVNPDTSLCPVNLDVSTISPALYTSVVKTVREPKRIFKLEIPSDWSHEGVITSHNRFVVSIPLEHNISSYCNCVVKITNVWVGSCEVPSELWEALVQLSRESLLLIDHNTKHLELEFMMKKEGAFSFNIGLMLDNGVSTSGLLRIQVEDPKIQVLTSDGNKVDFGLVPSDSSRSSSIMLVNCGHGNVPLYLQMPTSSHLFTFENGSMEMSFDLPGVESGSADLGQGVAKEIKIQVNTSGLALTETRICNNDLKIMLGSNQDGTVLGSLSLLAMVQAKELPKANFHATSSKPGLSFGVMQKQPVVSQSQGTQMSSQLPTVFPVESDRSLINFFCVGVGQSEQQQVALRNSTPDPVVLNLIIRETESFSFSGNINTFQLALEAHQTTDVSLFYCPKKLGKDSGKLVLKPQGKKLGGKSFKASIALNGVAGDSNIVINGVEKLDENNYSLCINDNYDQSLISFTNTGTMAGFVKILMTSATSNCLDLSTTAFILAPASKKTVNLSLIGNHESSSLQLSILHGAELARLVMKKARKLPGGARLCDNSSMMGFNFNEEIAGESIDSMQQEFSGQLTAVDVKAFFRKTIKSTLTLQVPHKPTTFDQLSVEETLSETRIDQSIALPLHTTNIYNKTTMEDKKECINSMNPPQTFDSSSDTIKLIPNRIQLKTGGEGLLKLVNLSDTRVHWDMSWPSSKLSLSPGSGILEPRCEAVVCVEAVEGGPSWKGQIQVYTDNSVLNVDVNISGGVQSSQAKPSQIMVNHKQVEFNMTGLGQTSHNSLSITNTAGCLLQWRAVMEPSFFSIAQSAGLLNPGQSVNLGLMFKPGAPGPHTATLTLSSVSVRGGQETGVPSPTQTPVTVMLSGSGVQGKVDAQPPASKTRPMMGGKKPNSGTVTLEKDVVVFPVVKVGELSIAKVKIENRSGSDKIVEILPLPSNSPFKTVHSVVEVKNRCFSTIPVHFQPRTAGEHSASVMCRWEGTIIMATLQGKTM